MAWEGLYGSGWYSLHLFIEIWPFLSVTEGHLQEESISIGCLTSASGRKTCPCSTRCTSLYKGLATFHIRCSRNCQWGERRSLGVGVQALASNPLQAAAVGNVAVVSVAERHVLLSWTQVNVFVKPDEQWWACSVIAMARKRRMKSNVFVKPNGQSKFTCILPWREKVHEMNHSMRCRYSWFKSCQKSVSDSSGDKSFNTIYVSFDNILPSYSQRLATVLPNVWQRYCLMFGKGFV